MRSTRPSWASMVMAVALVALAWVSIRGSGPPAPLGEDAAETVFSAGRAAPHVRAVAQKPHPMGSAEHARVRDYVISALQKLGFTVERQRTTAVRVRGGRARPRGIVVAGSVENLMVRLPGTASTGAVLLACHYDSVPAGPGAADDTAAVAAMLETLRVLRAGPPPRNDVIALLTDGEEDGLLGAEAFVSRHAWARDVRVVLNFEARGSGGPVQMFETTSGNAAVVGAWARAVPSPAGTSLAYEVYKRLANDSDFTEFKRLDAVGLNFAFIDHVEAYHTPQDAPNNLDQGSMQAQGDAALSLSRQFGDADLDLRKWRGRDAVFFSLPGGIVVRYSVLWAIPLVVAALVAWIWVLVRARRRGHASVGGILLALVILGAFLGLDVWAALNASDWIIRLQDSWEPLAAPVSNPAYALSLVCVAVFGWLVFYVLMRKIFAAHTLSLAATCVVLVVAGALAVALPGTSYLAAWPLLAALAATALLPLSTGTASTGAVSATVLAVLTIPNLAIFAPTTATLFSALLLSPEGATGMVVLVALSLSTMLPQMEVVTQGRRWWPALVVLLAGAGALVTGGYTAPHGPSHPRPETLIYALDTGAGRAVWATASDPPGPWLSQYVGHSPKRGPLSHFVSLATWGVALVSDAPAISQPGPTVVQTGSTDEGGGRLLTVRITSSRRARAVSVRIPDREVIDTRINGRLAGSRGDASTWLPGRWGLEYVNVPPEGIELTVRVKGSGPITLVVADRSDGLPDIPGRAATPRPAWSIPIHRGDMTILQVSVTFP